MQNALADRVERGLIQCRTLLSERKDQHSRAAAAADKGRRLTEQLHALTEKVRLLPAAHVGTVWRAIEIAEARGNSKERMATLLLGDAFFRAYKDLENMAGNDHASLPSAEREPSSDEIRAALQRVIASEA